jgi:hypothetical protein
MLAEEIIHSITCAISNDNHIVKYPLALSCGHSICHNCAGVTDKMQIRCKLCNQINRINLDDLSESKAAKQLIKVHFNQLFIVIEERFEKSLDQLKG